ncbi:putative transcriptional regulator [Xanthobacter flavus]|uniref:Transcriptional regulator n=1 Tax=Xanthobacter flavus TaxID=281 RepID=A0A9W6CSS6_XANFL|nr:transcriptional regulator [Xanthobacter flavus]MDR6336915.1 putative transcriptional regulator [Xanthobacter flavus]GLI25662.1 hypothetical protein XFLAVUS301_53360 [Xanthobacter flavus]
MNPRQAPQPTLSPEQCRAARAVLGLTVADLQSASGCSLATIVKFERGDDVRASTLARLRDALTERGAVFAADGRGLTW